MTTLPSGKDIDSPLPRFAGPRTAHGGRNSAFFSIKASLFQEIQKHPLKKLATLRGKTVALAFFETSTRTRISFGTAASRLGADTMNCRQRPPA